MKIQVIIPIYNPDQKFIQLICMLKMQSIDNLPVLIIDSGSSLPYIDYLDGMNYQVKHIDTADFNHGATRQMGVQMFPDADVYIFLTQDAILAQALSIERLVSVFAEPNVGCAYGRQLPNGDASLMAAHARLYNYGEQSYIRSIADKKKYGLKTAFISNSFAAYRKTALLSVGGFPLNVILAEDMYVAAKMLLGGWSIAYAADAAVYHSHNYTVCQEFKRYFDTGVFHAREPWIRQCFSQAEGEGASFVRSEIKYLIKHNVWLLPQMVLRDGMKYAGYKLGLHEQYINKALKIRLSMNPKYWNG